MSGQGKKYAKLVDECEDAKKGSAKALRKKPNAEKRFWGKGRRYNNMILPDKESESENITDAAENVQSKPKKRRCAICEEIERWTYNENGMSLRHFREFLVTHHLLKELNLM